MGHVVSTALLSLPAQKICHREIILPQRCGTPNRREPQLPMEPGASGAPPDP